MPLTPLAGRSTINGYSISIEKLATTFDIFLLSLLGNEEITSIQSEPTASNGGPKNWFISYRWIDDVH